MSHGPTDTPRIDLSSLLRRQVDVVVASPPSAVAEPVEPVATPVPGAVEETVQATASAAGPVASAADWQAAFERNAPAPSRADADTRLDADTPAAPVPGFLRRQIQRPASPWLWVPVIVLGLLLAVQILLADRERLAANPSLRPLLIQLCAPLGCDLPPWHEPQAITLVQRNVLPLPGKAGVLEIQAELRNDARWAQALPLIELTLSSADGQVSGQRQFLPDEYLPDGAKTLIQPGQSVQARWLVAEPALPADAFHFRFR